MIGWPSRIAPWGLCSLLSNLTNLVNLIMPPKAWEKQNNRVLI